MPNQAEFHVNPAQQACIVCGSLVATLWYCAHDANGLIHYMCGGQNPGAKYRGDKAQKARVHNDRHGRPEKDGWAPWKSVSAKETRKKAKALPAPPALSLSTPSGRRMPGKRTATDGRWAAAISSRNVARAVASACCTRTQLVLLSNVLELGLSPSETGSTTRLL